VNACHCEKSFTSGPYSEGELRGLNPLPPEKSTQKFPGLPFCCIVEHVQLKNVTVDVMNIIVTIIVGVKCAPESRMHQNAPFEGENTQIFLGGDTPFRDPIGAFSASIRVHLALEPPNHISGYGPVYDLLSRCYIYYSVCSVITAFNS